MRFKNYVVIASLITLATASMHYAQAQTTRAPACTIIGNPTTSSGGPVRLFYAVENRPTSIVIRADDSSASPSGIPSVGAPDPNTPNSYAVGSIDSGPITRNTIFTMTVSNANGSRNCVTDVFFAERPSAGWKVPLVSQDPVYDNLRIPDGFDTSLGYKPFETAYWVPGGYFVVSGNGNSAAGRGTGPGAGRRHRLEAGGMYGFREDGTFLGVRDVVFDTSVPASSCIHGGGCATYFSVSPLTPGKFVRDVGSRSAESYVRGPVVYSIGPSGFTLNKASFFNNRPSVNQSLQNDPVGRLETLKYTAVAGGKIVGVSSRYAGWYPVGAQERGSVTGIALARSSLQTEIFDAEFNKLASFSNPYPLRPPGGGSFSGVPPTTAPIFYPIVGVGDYVIAVQDPPGNNNVGRPPYTVYKIPSASELANGATPSNVGTVIENRSLYSYAVDVADPNRIALITSDRDHPSNANLRLTVLQAGSNGLTQVSSRNINLGRDRASGSGLAGFAFSGDYLAYGTCPATPLGHRGEISGGGRANGCKLVVERLSGERLSTEPLPMSRYSFYNFTPADSQAIGSVAMSPTGRIMVTTGESPFTGGAENGNIYMYQIDGAQSGPATPPLPPPPTPPTDGCNLVTGVGEVCDDPTESIPGQSLDVTFSATSTAPSILIRMARITSVTAPYLNISAFGRIYQVDTSNANILNTSWRPADFSIFTQNGLVNVWGTLDLANPLLIRGITVRDPFFVTVSPLVPNTTRSVSPVTTPTGALNQLNAIQEALQNLRLRLSR